MSRVRQYLGLMHPRRLRDGYKFMRYVNLLYDLYDLVALLCTIIVFNSVEGLCVCLGAFNGAFPLESVDAEFVAVFCRNLVYLSCACSLGHNHLLVVSVGDGPCRRISGGILSAVYKSVGHACLVNGLGCTVFNGHGVEILRSSCCCCLRFCCRNVNSSVDVGL